MFICFSSADRYTVTKSCLYHLKNYGFTVWYDYHELILGDKKREKNFDNAIKSNKYFIIIYSKNLFKSPCAIEEEKLIFEQSKDRDIVIFPLLYDIKFKFKELPDIYKSKLENLIYNEIDDTTGSISSINQIITKILIDKLNDSPYDLTPTIKGIDVENIDDLYLSRILYNYSQIDESNFNARISILFCLVKYIEIKYTITDENRYLITILNYLFKFTNLNVAYNHKELIIAELSLLLLIKAIS